MQVVVTQGSTLQVLLGLMVSIVFLLSQVQASPYFHDGDDYLGTACSFSLTAIFVCCVAFKYAELTDLEDIQAKMNQEQTDIFVTNSAFFTVLLFVSVLGGVIAFSIIFAIQYDTERRRPGPRRLRHTNDGAEVDAPPMPANEFHLFLSHTWAQGQSDMRIVKQVTKIHIQAHDISDAPQCSRISPALPQLIPPSRPLSRRAVSYTHLRAHET